MGNLVVKNLDTHVIYQCKIYPQLDKLHLAAIPQQQQQIQVIIIGHLWGKKEVRRRRLN